MKKELNYKIEITNGKFILWLKSQNNWIIAKPNGFESYSEAKNYLRVFKK